MTPLLLEFLVAAAFPVTHIACFLVIGLALRVDKRKVRR